MLRRDHNRAHGLHLDTKAPLGRDWPRTAGAHAVDKDPETGTPRATPPHAPQLGDTYQEQNADVHAAAEAQVPPDPDPSLTAPLLGEDDEEPQPLASISELQELVLRKRNLPQTEGMKAGTEDTHVVRQRPQFARMAIDTITPEKLQRFLVELERCGVKHVSARKSKLTWPAIKELMKRAPEMKELVEVAMERYRESLEREAHRRGVEGWDVPIIGGKFKDEIVAYEKKYDGKLLELMLKRHIPEYRERFEGEIKVTGGVLVVPAPALSADEWQRVHGGDRTQTLAQGADPAMLPAPRSSNPEVVADS